MDWTELTRFIIPLQHKAKKEINNLKIMENELKHTGLISNIRLDLAIGGGSKYTLYIKNNTQESHRS